jgi:hypothetical protein
VHVKKNATRPTVFVLSYEWWWQLHDDSTEEQREDENDRDCIWIIRIVELCEEEDAKEIRIEETKKENLSISYGIAAKIDRGEKNRNI